MSVVSAKAGIRRAALKAKQIAADNTKTLTQRQEEMALVEAQVKSFQDELDLNDKLNRIHDPARLPGEFEDTHTTRGTAPSLTLDADEIKAWHGAIRRHLPYKGQVGGSSGWETRSLSKTDAGTPSQLVPPTLLPGIVAMTHEPLRIMQLVTSSAVSAPSIEYIRHSSTTGQAAPVAAGALKPAVTLNTERVIVPACKIAVTTTVNDEDLDDFTAFVGYLQQELSRLVIDAENAQLLNGDGTDTNMLGLLATPGILTRARGSDTALDAVEQAITDLRVAPAKATPTFAVMHPTTFSAVRRSKDQMGRYLLSADPSAEQTSQLWGLPVVQTTQIAPGTALMADGSSIQVGIRSGLTFQSNYSGDDFTHNRTTIRCEERIMLMPLQPSAICKITGLDGTAVAPK